MFLAVNQRSALKEYSEAGYLPPGSAAVAGKLAG